MVQRKITNKIKGFARSFCTCTITKLWYTHRNDHFNVWPALTRRTAFNFHNRIKSVEIPLYHK